VSAISVRAPVIRPNMELDQISECFLQGYRELPVCDDGKVLGTIKHIDVLKFLLENGRIPPKRASEIMYAPINSIRETDSITQAASMMRQKNINHLVVVNDKGDMVGIVSSADVFPMLEQIKQRPPFAHEKIGASSIPLKSVVIPEVHTIKLGSTLPEVAKEMIENDTSVLIVYDKEPLGLVHVFELLKSSLPTSEPFFEIVGLEPEDKEFRDDIRREGLRTLERIAAIFPVETGKLSVKKQRKEGGRARFTMKLQLMGKERLSVEATDWDMFKALHCVLKEATRIAKREKSRLKGKRDLLGKRRAFSIKVRDGEISMGKKQI
jgi:CBS domain-containing protein